MSCFNPINRSPYLQIYLLTDHFSSAGNYQPTNQLMTRSYAHILAQVLLAINSRINKFVWPILWSQGEIRGVIEQELLVSANFRNRHLLFLVYYHLPGHCSKLYVGAQLNFHNWFFVITTRDVSILHYGAR